MFDRQATLNLIAAKVERFSGQRYAAESQNIFVDFNISGSDFVELFKQIDMEFGANTKRITKRAVGRKKVTVDVSVGQIVDFLVNSRDTSINDPA